MTRHWGRLEVRLLSSGIMMIFWVVLVALLFSMTKHLGKPLNKEMAYFGSQFNGLHDCGKEVLAEGSSSIMSHCIHCWEPGSDECWYSANFLLFTQSGKTPLMMVSPTFRLNLCENILTNTSKVVFPWEFKSQSNWHVEFIILNSSLSEGKMWVGWGKKGM